MVGGSPAVNGLPPLTGGIDLAWLVIDNTRLINITLRRDYALRQKIYIPLDIVS